MLHDPRAREAIDEFTAQWLRFDRLFSSLKDRRVYPQFSPSLLDAMAEETRRLIRHLVWEDRPFTEVFSADYSFLNAELAGLYGIPAPSAPFALTRYPADSERAGVLGHGTFLAQTGKPEETSPTERGLFIREHFLCQGVPPPPPGVNVTLPPFAIDVKPVTNRERMTKLHLTNPSCAGCHVLIDPIGFGLERFDTMGQWHAKQPVTIFPTQGPALRGEAPGVRTGTGHVGQHSRNSRFGLLLRQGARPRPGERPDLSKMHRAAMVSFCSGPPRYRS